MKISDIRIGDRHRKDMGDLQVLADSIALEGLLQPVGVTESGELVFGQRRLLACRDLLGWTDIPARKVNVSSILAGEYAENTLRKDFTPSERVAIAEAVKRELGERRGRPGTENTTPVSEIFPGRETREVAAEHSGFGSVGTFQNAKRAVDHGVPELVEAMDKGTVSIKAAAVLADLPPPKQREIIKAGPDTIRRVVHAARPENRNKHPVTYRVPKAKSSLARLDNALNLLSTVTDGIVTLDLAELQGAPVERRNAWLSELARCLKDIRAFRRRLENASLPGGGATDHRPVKNQLQTQRH